MESKERTDCVARSLGLPLELLAHAPELLADLWSLRFSSEPVIRLLERQGLGLSTDTRMLDFGCGKGALLIQLAGRFGWAGLGIDVMPEFIFEARQYALSRGVAHLVKFQTLDMATAVGRERPAELVIFGYDSDVLGVLDEALRRLCLLVSSGGHMLLETAWSTPGCASRRLLNESETRRAIEGASLRVVDHETLTTDWVREQNACNTLRIRARAEALAQREPDLKNMILAFLLVREEECRVLEEQAQCVALLLAKA